MADPLAAGGGAVKLRYLSRKYPDAIRSGSILYLVSSALPKGALGWVRAARANGIKVVVNQNGVGYPAWASEKQMREVNGRFQEILKLADYVIYQSEFCRVSCEKWVNTNRVPSSVIYNPVDLQLFRPKTVEKTFDLLLMGSCSQADRVQRPLQALALAKRNGLPWKMLIAGRLLWPKAAAEFHRWLAELDVVDRVHWHGAYAQDEAPNLYSSAKILVHMQDKDASPTVPLEAMACGLPVLGIGSGGMPELVPESCGLLLHVVKSWDDYFYPSAHSLFEGAKNLLAKKNAMECHRHVEEKFSLDLFLAKHEKIFQAVVK
jgi:glycosyltransferase involved in cell wall biosynthesis